MLLPKRTFCLLLLLPTLAAAQNQSIPATDASGEPRIKRLFDTRTEVEEFDLFSAPLPGADASVESAEVTPAAAPTEIGAAPPVSARQRALDRARAAANAGRYAAALEGYAALLPTGNSEQWLMDVDRILASVNEELVSTPEDIDLMALASAIQSVRAATTDREISPALATAQANLTQARAVQRARAAQARDALAVAIGELSEATSPAASALRSALLADAGESVRQWINAEDLAAAAALVVAIDGYGDPGPAQELVAATTMAISSGDLAQGETVLSTLAGGGLANDTLAPIRHGLAMVGFVPGERIQADIGATALEMVVLDTQAPVMGWAMSTTEISVGQFAEFVAQTGYRTVAERIGHSELLDTRTGETRLQPGIDWRHSFDGRDAEAEQPVVHVAREDAMAYAQWLSDITGERYELPTAAVYAFLLGGDQPFWWGMDTPVDGVENLAGANDPRPRRAEFGFRFIDDYRDGSFGVADVGSFRPSPAQIYDLAGNVSEWTIDCFQTQDDTCLLGLAKGGAFNSGLENAAASSQTVLEPTASAYYLGFRVVRRLNAESFDGEDGPLLAQLTDPERVALND